MNQCLDGGVAVMSNSAEQLNTWTELAGNAAVQEWTASGTVQDGATETPAGIGSQLWTLQSYAATYSTNIGTMVTNGEAIVITNFVVSTN